MVEAKDTKRDMANIYAIWFMVDCWLNCNHTTSVLNTNTNEADYVDIGNI